MYGKKPNKQKMKWGAAGQCLLIILSFLPVWLLRANEAPEPVPAGQDTITIDDSYFHWTATSETAYPLEVPRP